MAHTVYHGIGANEPAKDTSRDAMRRARDATRVDARGGGRSKTTDRRQT
jgi:hypothetical protein